LLVFEELGGPVQEAAGGPGGVGMLGWVFHGGYCIGDAEDVLGGSY
jgi:hypothetical protein